MMKLVLFAVVVIGAAHADSSWQCGGCRRLMGGFLRPFLEDNRRNVLYYFLDLCHQIEDPTLNQTCDDFVREEVQSIINDDILGISDREFCEMVTICEEEEPVFLGKGLSQKKECEEMADAELFQERTCNGFRSHKLKSGCKKLFKMGGSGVTRSLQRTVMHHTGCPQKLVGREEGDDPPGCDTCISMLSFFVDRLLNNVGQEATVDTLANVCLNFDSVSAATECRRFVEDFLNLSYESLRRLIVPRSICQFMTACPTPPAEPEPTGDAPEEPAPEFFKLPA